MHHYRQQRRANPAKQVNEARYGVTQSGTVKHCGCHDVLPWEDCEHSAEVTDREIDADSLRHLRDCMA